MTDYKDYFAGKTAIVTGASKGIGRAVTLALTRFGCRVIAVARTAALLESLSAEAEEGLVRPVVCDLSDWETSRAALSGALPADEGPVHFLVNNAGGGKPVPVGFIEESDFDSQFALNVNAAINVSQVAVERMLKTGVQGAIVNIGSVAAARSTPTAPLLLYCASKAALESLTRCLALEFSSQKIRVNLVAPQVVENEMGRWVDMLDVREQILSTVPLNKFATNENVVEATLYLLSDSSSMITGATLPVEGGFLST